MKANNIYRVQLSNPKTSVTIFKFFACDNIRNLRGWLKMAMPLYWRRGGKFIHTSCERVAHSIAEGAPIYDITAKFGKVKTCEIYNEIINHLTN